MAVDRRADIYSLAVIAYEMLCCRLPFQSEDFVQLVNMHVHEAPKSPHERDSSVSRALSEIVLSGLEKDPARRPSSAGAFASKLRAFTEGELTLLRTSKDLFHTHSNCFVPLLILCLLPIPAVLIPLRWLAHLALEAKLAPAWFLTPACGLTGVAMSLFGLQLYKVACLLTLEKAAETGQFRPEFRSIFSYLIRRLPSMLRTHLRSMLDLRPSSFRYNLLWPVIWAKENRSGKQAIDRSRELCRTLPEASIALMVRQYAPSLMSFLFHPAIFLVFPKDPTVFSDFLREALSGSMVGPYLVFGPFMFVMFYLNIGSAFSLLYGSALRCRGEGGDIAFPASSRGSTRNGSSFAMRPATLLWAGIPTIMLTAMLVKIISRM